MPERRSDEEIRKWHRWFAVECNNAAWTLAERADRVEAEDAEMLSLAHASLHHWRQVGTEENAALGEMLVGQAHALLGHGAPAMRYAVRAFDWVTANGRPAWEVAFAHAVLANAARAAGESALYAERHRSAAELGAGLGPEDKAIFDATFRLIPPP